MSNSRCDIDLCIDFTGALTVKWTGAANERRPSAALSPLFERLLSTKRYLRFDFSELQHMSSSTLVVVMKFFKELNKLGIGFDLRFDDRSAWQRMTFAQLGSLATPEMQLAA